MNAYKIRALRPFEGIVSLCNSIRQIRFEVDYRRYLSQCETQRRREVLLAQELCGGKDLYVQSGPFIGMRYIDRAFGSAWLPKLVGSYERELHPWVDAIIAKNYRTIIDIGCAEGYYAVGLARSCPDAHVFAYDQLEFPKRLCRRLARLNRIENLSVRGFCTHGALESVIGDSTIIISDCEGGEAGLLDPDACPGLLECDLLIEVHDEAVEGLSSTLIRRFESTHELQWKDEASVPQLNLPRFSESDRQLLLNECRGHKGLWLFARRKELL